MITIRRIYRGDVYLTEIENTKDSEQKGIRPAVIIQNDTGNKYSPTTIVAFVTSRNKNDLPTHVQIHCKSLTDGSTVMLEQIRTVSVSRLKKYIGKLGRYDTKNINTALMISLGIWKGKINDNVKR